MKPIPFEGMNKIYLAPEGWDAEKMGECRPLPVRQEQGSITSCYELSGADLAKLAHGANLYFTIYQNQQPVVGWEIR